MVSGKGKGAPPFLTLGSVEEKEWSGAPPILSVARLWKGNREHKNHLQKLPSDSAINAKRIESFKAYHASKSGMSEKQSDKLLENSRSEKNLANLKAYNDRKSIQVKVFDNESETTAVYAS